MKLRKTLMKNKSNQTIELDKINGTYITEDDDLIEDLDLIESQEKGFHVYHEEECVGSLTLWCDGTMTYFDDSVNEDFDISNRQTLISIIERYHNY